MLKFIIQLILLMFPWFIRRRALNVFFGFDLAPDSKIGLSLIDSVEVILKPRAKIGNFNIIKGLSRLHLSEAATIGQGNWVTGYPIGRRPHFLGQLDRMPALLMGEHSAITGRHIIDCTDEVMIGRFSTFGGFRSQILTHSIDVYAGCQRSGSVRIGDYCFIGTEVILLPGSSLPNFSVLAAGAVLNKCYKDSFGLYAGNPAIYIKSLPHDIPYFGRIEGFVV